MCWLDPMNFEQGENVRVVKMNYTRRYYGGQIGTMFQFLYRSPIILFHCWEYWDRIFVNRW